MHLYDLGPDPLCPSSCFSPLLGLTVSPYCLLCLLSLPATLSPQSLFPHFLRMLKYHLISPRYCLPTVPSPDNGQVTLHSLPHLPDPSSEQGSSHWQLHCHCLLPELCHSTQSFISEASLILSISWEGLSKHLLEE